MKYHLRVPTKDPYAYLEAEGEFDAPEAAFEAYRGIQKAVSGEKSGLSDKEMTEYIYRAINDLGNSPDVWELMSPTQQNVLKCYRNAQNRKKPV